MDRKLNWETAKWRRKGPRISFTFIWIGVLYWAAIGDVKCHVSYFTRSLAIFGVVELDMSHQLSKCDMRQDLMGAIWVWGSVTKFIRGIYTMGFLSWPKLICKSYKLLNSLWYRKKYVVEIWNISIIVISQRFFFQTSWDILVTRQML